MADDSENILDFAFDAMFESINHLVHACYIALRIDAAMIIDDCAGGCAARANKMHIFQHAIFGRTGHQQAIFLIHTLAQKCARVYGVVGHLIFFHSGGANDGT